jgi:hypothetical protein
MFKVDIFMLKITFLCESCHLYCVEMIVEIVVVLGCKFWRFDEGFGACC